MISICFEWKINHQSKKSINLFCKDIMTRLFRMIQQERQIVDQIYKFAFISFLLQLGVHFWLLELLNFSTSICKDNFIERWDNRNDQKLFQLLQKKIQSKVIHFLCFNIHFPKEIYDLLWLFCCCFFLVILCIFY